MSVPGWRPTLARFDRRRALLAVVLAILIGSAAAFSWTERLKLEAPPVGSPKFERQFSPGCDCRAESATLSILVRRPDRVDASVVDADGGHVATIATDRRVRPGRVGFTWNGKDDDGRIVPDGTYRLRLRLEDARRTILVPRQVHVDTTAPRVRVRSVVRRGGGMVVIYRSNEPGHAVLLLDGKPVERGERGGAGSGRLEWAGPVRTSARGLSLVFVDRARNRSRPAAVHVDAS